MNTHIIKKIILNVLMISYMLPQLYAGINYTTAQKVLNAVVKINVSRSLDTNIQNESNYMQVIRKGDKISGEVVYGSGFIFHPEGYIATNFHVLGEEGAEIQKIFVTLANGQSYKAKIVGYDRFFDILVLKIEGSKFPTLSWGDASKVVPTQTLYAFGHPLGFDHSVISCFVAAIKRNINVNDLLVSTRSFPDGITRGLIQLDGNLNPGLSGGPVTDENGLLVGMSSSNFGHDEHSVGIGFCLPEDKIRPILEEIRLKKQVISRGALGVQVQDVDEKIMRLKGLKELSGVMVTEVYQDSSAVKAGLKTGDIILSVNGHIIDSASTLRYIIKVLPLKVSLPMDILREGKMMKLNLTLLPSNEKETIIHVSTDKTSQIPSSKTESVGLYLKNLTPQLAAEYGFIKTTKGVVLERFAPNEDQYETDLRTGDIIEAIDNIPVAKLDDVERLIAQALSRKKSSILLLIHRSGEGKRFEALPL